MDENPYKSPEREGIKLAPAWRRIVGVSLYTLAVPFGMLAGFAAYEGMLFLVFEYQHGLPLDGVIGPLALAGGCTVVAVSLACAGYIVRRKSKIPPLSV